MRSDPAIHPTIDVTGTQAAELLDGNSPPPARRPAKFPGLIATAALAVGLSACGAGDPAATAQRAPPPPPEVGVITVTKGAVALTADLPGRLEALRMAQVRARVAGIVESRDFREGTDVKAGQPLFHLDAAPSLAALASAQAVLARSQANLIQASAQAERYKPLAEAHAVSQQDLIAAVAAQAQAQADVAAGKAAVQTATINLGYATIVAPLSGRIGRALVTEGALVGQGEATALAVIQQLDPIVVNLTQSSAEVLKLRRLMDRNAPAGTPTSKPTAPAGSSRSAAAKSPPPVVILTLEDGSTYSHAGKLLFADLSVDPATGQVSLRAEVPNPEGLLLPGMYVRVRLEQARLADAVMLPQQAVQRFSNGDSVMVVGADGVVASRKVSVSASRDNQWIVSEGLQPGELVMVDGFQKLRGPGPVKPVPWRAAASGTNGATGSVPAAAAASAPASVPASAPRN
jgi:membrane fusion protein (multidrug efflux system)